MAMTVEQQRALAMAQARLRAAGNGAPREREMGMLWPVSWNADDGSDYSFDSNAGLLGAIKQAITAPGRAMSGELQVMGPDGNVSPEAIAEGFNFAGAATPANPAVRVGERVVPGIAKSMRKADIEPPTAEALKQASSKSYDAMRESGVDYSSAAVDTLARRIKSDLEADGVLQELAPKTHRVLDALTNPPEGSVVSISGLEAARRALGHAGKDFANPTDQLASSRSVRGLDEFIRGGNEENVVAGTASEAARHLSDARGNYAAAKRSEAITGIEDAAELRAAAANSGANSGNSTRQRIASLLLAPRKVSGFDDSEIKSLEKVVKGSRRANATRRLGNLLGGGGGLGQVAAGAAGAAVGSVFGPTGAAVGAAALPGIGHLSKTASNVLTERALQAVERSTRKRSPLYEEMLRDAPDVAVMPNKTAAAIRAAILGLQGQNGGGGW